MAKVVKAIEATIDFEELHNETYYSFPTGGVVMLWGTPTDIQYSVSWYMDVRWTSRDDEQLFIYAPAPGVPGFYSYDTLDEGPWTLKLENSIETQEYFRYYNGELMDSYAYPLLPGTSVFPTVYFWVSVGSLYYIQTDWLYLLVRGLILDVKVTWEDDTIDFWPWNDQSELDDWESMEELYGGHDSVMENGYLRSAIGDNWEGGIAAYMIQPTLDNLTLLQAPVGKPVWQYLVDSSGLTEDTLP